MGLVTFEAAVLWLIFVLFKPTFIIFIILFMVIYGSRTIIWSLLSSWVSWSVIFFIVFLICIFFLWARWRSWWRLGRRRPRVTSYFWILFVFFLIVFISSPFAIITPLWGIRFCTFLFFIAILIPQERLKYKSGFSWDFDSLFINSNSYLIYFSFKSFNCSWVILKPKLHNYRSGFSVITVT